MSLIIFMIGNGVSVNDVNAKAHSIDEIKKDREQLKKELSKKEKEIVRVLEDIEQLHDEMSKVEAELQENELKIERTEAEIMQYEEDFYTLLDKIEKLNEQIEARHDILKNRMAAYQEGGGDITFLEVLLNAKSFTEFISRATSVSHIANADRELIEQQTADKKKVQKHQDEITEKINEQEKLLDNLQTTQEEITKKQDSIKKSEQKLKDQEKKLTQAKKKISNEDRRLKDIEDQYRRDIKKKQNKVTEVKSTKKTNNSSMNKTKSEPINVGKTYRMESTAYTPHCNGCSGFTATGINVKQNGRENIIAVDPSVIPLGTRVWVEGYGEAIAADTGGAIKGNRIDVLFQSKQKALNWGRKTVTVKILN